jgi:hypothetical protein
MIPEIWVAGFPTFYGGADTELDHQIDLWTNAGFAVHLVPMYGGTDNARMVDSVRSRGATVHEYDPEIFRDRLVVSFCNGAFLDALPVIHIAGKPRRVVWANCMTWSTKQEKTCHKIGLIDDFIFHTAYQERRLRSELEPLRPVHSWKEYIAYFNPRRYGVDQTFRPATSYFGVGRVSRCDPAKYRSELWSTFGKVTSPVPVKAFVLGFNEQVAKKTGKPEERCPGLDFLTWDAGGTPIEDFYPRIHCLIHMVGGSRENWPRTVIESWTYGIVPIVDDDFGVAEMVTNGVDGFRVKTPDEASFRASQLAFDADLRRRMVEAGFDTLNRVHANADAAGNAWRRLYAETFPELCRE